MCERVWEDLASPSLPLANPLLAALEIGGLTSFGLWGFGREGFISPPIQLATYSDRCIVTTVLAPIVCPLEPVLQTQKIMSTKYLLFPVFI